MSHELYFTSAPRGLRPGSNGYCTVTATQGLPGPLWQKLETLSDYRPLSDDDGGTARHPIALSHLRVAILGKTWSVLSRSCMAGVDHSRRRIFFTHHVALETTELPPGGPAWLMGQRNFLEARWDNQVRELPAGRAPVMGNSTPAVCRAWQQAAGDAGWAGVLAEEFEKNPNRPVYILYPLSVDPLPLLQEALALLPAERRWQVTFSTLYRSLPQDVACIWRCLPLEAPEARKAQALPGALVLDLGQPLGQAEGGSLVEAARSGKTPRVYAPPRVAAPQPVAAGAWKPAVRSIPEAEDDQPEPEREPPRVEILHSPAAGSGPRRRGSWLVPLALGLLIGVLLIGGGAVGGWRVLEQAKEKALAKALDKAEQDKVKAIKDTEVKADRQREKALQAANEDKKKAIAAFDQLQQEKRKATEALQKFKQESEAAKKKAVADALKGKVSQADLEADLKPRNEALKILVSFLFSEKDKEKVAIQIKEKLEAIQNSKESELAKLGGLLEKWVDHERQSYRKKEFWENLGNLETLVKNCEKMKEDKEREDLIEDPKYRNTYEEAQKLYKRMQETTSVLARRELEVRFRDRLSAKRLPVPKPARKKR